jgi:hypothetical protein
MAQDHIPQQAIPSALLDDKQIVSTLSRQLSWSHFKEIIYNRDERR